MRSWKLRPATDADHDAIAAVWHSSASLPGVGPLVMPTLGELRERVDLGLASGWNITVAASGSDVIGFVAVSPGKAVLNELFVRPGSIGSGVGRALLAHAMAAMPNGFSLYTRSANVRARQFYENAGLIPLREDVHPRTGDPVIHYRWNVR